MKIIFSVLAENKPGVLARITTLFAGKMYPLYGVLMLPQPQSDRVQILIATDESKATVRHMTQQLERIVEVIEVSRADEDALLKEKLADASQWRSLWKEEDEKKRATA